MPQICARTRTELKANRNIRLIANRNDFLISPEGLAWIRSHIRSRGGDALRAWGPFGKPLPASSASGDSRGARWFGCAAKDGNCGGSIDGNGGEAVEAGVRPSSGAATEKHGAAACGCLFRISVDCCGRDDRTPLQAVSSAHTQSRRRGQEIGAGSISKMVSIMTGAPMGKLSTP